MAFTLVAYSASQDTSGVLTTTAALADPHVRVSGNDVSIPAETPNIAGVYAIGATMTRAALVSPSIRRRYPFEVFPVDAAATPTDPWHFHDVAQQVIALDVDESLNFQFAESGAGAQRGSGLVWLSDGPINPDTSGEFFTIRATGTTTLSTYAWTNCTLTFNDTLPAGTDRALRLRPDRGRTHLAPRPRSGAVAQRDHIRRVDAGAGRNEPDARRRSHRPRTPADFRPVTPGSDRTPCGQIGRAHV